MTTVYIVDTGVFVLSGGPDREKFQWLRWALRQADVSLYFNASTKNSVANLYVRSKFTRYPTCPHMREHLSLWLAWLMI
jgi:hypothetical protein